MHGSCDTEHDRIKPMVGSFRSFDRLDSADDCRREGRSLVPKHATLGILNSSPGCAPALNHLICLCFTAPYVGESCLKRRLLTCV